MEVNGFNSNDYLYFRITANIPYDGMILIDSFQQGDIIKIPLKSLGRYVFETKNYERITSYSLPHEIISYQAGTPFDLLEYIKMQVPFEFNRDGSLTLGFYGPYVLIDDWLEKKINSSNLSNPGNQPTCSNFDIRTIKENNEWSMQELEKFNNTQLSISNGNNNFIAEYIKNPSPIYKIHVGKYGLKFEIPFSENEKWSFDNISLLLCLLNQNFVNLIYNSFEITGPEKDEIFWSEYKDNIPNTTIRYYKIKDGICVKKIVDLCGECSLEHFGCGYSALRAIGGGYISVCEYNPNNYNLDGSIRYFCVDFSDGISDSESEKEILKIADRVPQEEAVKLYNMDIEATQMHEKQEEIKEQADYRKFKKMYEKRNPGMSEENCIVEFMKLMEQKERKARKARNDCLQQIVTGLYNAMSKLNDGQEEPNVSEKS